MTCIFSSCISKNVLKCILKHMFIQYYAMKSKNLYFLIIDLNNIHGLNTLNYILRIFSKKIDMSLIGILYRAYAQGVKYYPIV
jgi:hypothetical protein